MRAGVGPVLRLGNRGLAARATSGAILPEVCRINRGRPRREDEVRQRRSTRALPAGQSSANLSDAALDQGCAHPAPTGVVVRTNGFRDDLWIDMAGAPMTSAATMTERIRRPTYGTLEVEITIDDPKAYTRPWTVKLNQELMLDTELIDEVCLENEKSWRHMQTPDTAK